MAAGAGGAGAPGYPAVAPRQATVGAAGDAAAGETAALRDAATGFSCFLLIYVEGSDCRSLTNRQFAGSACPRCASDCTHAEKRNPDAIVCYLAKLMFLVLSRTSRLFMKSWAAMGDAAQNSSGSLVNLPTSNLQLAEIK